MRKKQKQELIRNLLYAFSGVIVGGAVGGALLMKMVTEGDTRRAQADAAAESSAVQTAPPEESGPESTPEPSAPEPLPEPEIIPPDADAIRALIGTAEPLLTMTYCYTDSDCYETHSEIWGKKVPFTTDTVVLTCDGTICMAVDADAIGYTVDPEDMLITVTLPEPQVTSHELDADSIQYYDVKSSLFRSPTFADYTALIRDLKESICERVVSDREFGRLTLEQTETVIRSCLSVSEITAEYAVTFILPEPETEAPAQTETLPEEPEIPDAPADTPRNPFWW